MKRVILILLAILVVVGLFAAVGYTGYRFGYAQGIQTTREGDDARPGLRPFDDVRPRGMPMRPFGFERGFARGFDGFPLLGFEFFSLLRLILPIAVLALAVWFIYWLFTRSGWQLTRTAPVAKTPPTPAETEPKE